MTNFIDKINSFRHTFGSILSYDGNEYTCVADISPAAKTGSGFLTKNGLDALGAALDPRVFNVNASDFSSIPNNTDEIIWSGNTYIITKVDHVLFQGVLTTYRIWAFKKMIGGVGADVLPTAAYTLYTPKTLINSVDSISKNLPDLLYTNAGSIQCYLNPLKVDEKLMSFGKADVRGNTCFTISQIPLGSILKGSGSNDNWVAWSPTQYYAGEKIYQAIVKHTDVLPASIT